MKTVIHVAFLIVVLNSSALALVQSDLDELDEKFARQIERVMPGWKHKRVEPVVKEEHVLIQFWYSSERSVKIAVMPYRSAADAKAALAEFLRSERDTEQINQVGDEGYACGFANSNVVFRKGKLLVFVNSRVDVGAAPEERGLSQDERLEREKNEMRRWSREFAKHAAKALDNP